MTNTSIKRDSLAEPARASVRSPEQLSSKLHIHIAGSKSLLRKCGPSLPPTETNEPPPPIPSRGNYLRFFAAETHSSQSQSHVENLDYLQYRSDLFTGRQDRKYGTVLIAIAFLVVQ